MLKFKNKFFSNKKVYIESYGCQMNFSDSEIVSSILLNEGFDHTKKAENADLILINTCSIREKAEDNIEEMGVNDNLSKLKKQSLENIIALESCDVPVVLCCDMGTRQQKMIYTNLAKLSELQGGRMNCLVFPASTSDVEEKALLRWLKEE